MALGKLPDDDAGGGLFSEINITPLTDIFLVLLIIFMVTSVAMVDSGAKVMLPEVDETQSRERRVLGRLEEHGVGHREDRRRERPDPAARQADLSRNLRRAGRGVQDADHRQDHLPPVFADQGDHLR